MRSSLNRSCLNESKIMRIFTEATTWLCENPQSSIFPQNSDALIRKAPGSGPDLARNSHKLSTAAVQRTMSTALRSPELPRYETL